MEKIGSLEILLYEDICRVGHRVDDLRSITRTQVEFLISLTYNNISPQYDGNGLRKWYLKGKGKHGGFLRLEKLAKIFFALSENQTSLSEK